MMTDGETIFTIIIGCLIVLPPVIRLLIQTFVWNRGTCEKTNRPWELVDIDSTGARIYKSEEHKVWISWRFLDINN